MTVTTTVSGNFHRSSCFPMGNDPNQGCRNKQLQLSYRCSTCASQCLKCIARQLNANASYARGCEEARQAVERTLSCVCAAAQTCEYKKKQDRRNEELQLSYRCSTCASQCLKCMHANGMLEAVNSFKAFFYTKKGKLKHNML